MHEYDLIADWYAADRTTSTGVPEVERLLASLPRGASVLDVGCGNGIPITRTLLAAGCDVLGVDSSPLMLERFRANCPGTHVRCEPIQSCRFRESTFDAAVAWGILFHLELPDQARALRNISRALKPCGWLLFTSGDAESSVEGTMNGVRFRYFSHGVEGYRAILAEHDLTLLDVSKDAGQNVYYLARKQPAAQGLAARGPGAG